MDSSATPSSLTPPHGAKPSAVAPNAAAADRAAATNAGPESAAPIGPAASGAKRRRERKLEAAILWILGGSLAAAAIGCLAGLLESRNIAPVGLLPLAVGAGVSMAAEPIGRALGLGIGRSWIVAAMAWALVAIGAEVTVGYWDHMRDSKNFERSHAKAALFSDGQSAMSATSLLRYFQARYDQSPALMIVDALLTVGAAAAWMEYRRRATVARSRTPAT